MEVLPKFKVHSANLWDYLPDMPYLPDAADRESVLTRAKKSGHEHRIQIWDYFFRPQAKHVGIPIRQELKELEERTARTEESATHELENYLKRISDLESELLSEQAKAEVQLKSIADSITKRETDAGNALKTTGTLWLGAAILAALWAVGTDSGCLAFLLVPASLVGSILGISQLLQGQKICDPKRIQGLIETAQKGVVDALAQFKAKTDSKIADLDKRCAECRSILNRLVPHLRARLKELRDLLQQLLDQIPPSPTPEQVETWLKADLETLIDAGARQLGVHLEQIRELYNGNNPIILQGPAELQGVDEIPVLCVRRQKYMFARRLGRLASEGRKLYQHYGIFCAEFLFISEMALGRFSVYYDFIRGEVLNERAPLQHFADVVVLEMRREFREVEIGGRRIEILHAPSLRLSLKDGDEIYITLPNGEYFEAIGAEGFDHEEGGEDASQIANNAMAAIRQKIDQAKKNLEISELAKQAERRAHVTG